MVQLIGNGGSGVDPCASVTKPTYLPSNPLNVQTDITGCWTWDPLQWIIFRSIDIWIKTVDYTPLPTPEPTPPDPPVPPLPECSEIPVPSYVPDPNVTTTDTTGCWTWDPFPPFGGVWRRTGTDYQLDPLIPGIEKYIPYIIALVGVIGAIFLLK
jgi:hypothetical protein